MAWFGPQISSPDSVFRAVQAYATVRFEGGSQAQAEHAASLYHPPVPIPEIARMANAARGAAGQLMTETPTANRSYGQYQRYATQWGSGVQVATVRVEYTPGGVWGTTLNLPNQWVTVQVELPAGATRKEMADRIRDTAQRWIQGADARYPGTIVDYAAVSVIGMIPGGP